MPKKRINELVELESLSANDLFLVEQLSGSSYLSKNIKYSTLVSEIESSIPTISAYMFDNSDVVSGYLTIPDTKTIAEILDASGNFHLPGIQYNFNTNETLINLSGFDVTTDPLFWRVRFAQGYGGYSTPLWQKVSGDTITTQTSGYNLLVDGNFILCGDLNGITTIEGQVLRANSDGNLRPVDTGSILTTTITGDVDLSLDHFIKGSLRANKPTDVTLTIKLQTDVAYKDDAILKLTNIGAGNLIVDAVSGVTLNGLDGGYIVIAQWQGGALERISEDNWMIPNYDVT